MEKTISRDVFLICLFACLIMLHREFGFEIKGIKLTFT